MSTIVEKHTTRKLAHHSEYFKNSLIYEEYVTIPSDYVLYLNDIVNFFDGHETDFSLKLMRVADFLEIPVLVEACLKSGIMFDSGLSHADYILNEKTRNCIKDRSITHISPLNIKIEFPIKTNLNCTRLGNIERNKTFFHQQITQSLYVESAIEEALPIHAKIIMNSGNFVCAGGFPARHLISLAGYCDTPAPSDIDFFIIENNEDCALFQIRTAIISLNKYCKEKQIGNIKIRSNQALTIGVDDCNLNIQIILKRFANISQLLASFDIEICRVAYYQRKIHVADTAQRALSTGNIISDWRWESPTFASRLFKYCKLGFELIVDRSRKEYIMPNTTFDKLCKLFNNYKREEKKTHDIHLLIHEFHTNETTVPGEQVIKRTPHENEKEPGPIWGVDNVIPTQIDNVRSRSIQKIMTTISPPYTTGSCVHEFIEIWKEQKKRKRGDSSNYWRQRLATVTASDIFRNENVDYKTESIENSIIPNIVWQQLDCHPVEGKWNLDKIRQLNENPSKPLDSMRYIEDASYVLSPCQRSKLSRVIRIPSYIQST